MIQAMPQSWKLLILSNNEDRNYLTVEDITKKQKNEQTLVPIYIL